MGKKIIGIDIRHDAVTAVLVECSIKENVLSAYVRVPINLENKDNFHKKITDTLLKVSEKIDFNEAVCVVSYPLEDVYIHNLRLPFTNRNKILQILPFELESSLPFPADNLTLAFDLYDKFTKDPKFSDIIVACIKNSTLSDLLTVLSTKNIDPDILTLNGYGTALYISKNHALKNSWMYIDIYQNNSQIFAGFADSIYLIRTFKNNITSNTLEKTLAVNIKRTIAAASELYDIEEAPETIFLSGGGLIKPDFEQNLSKLLDIPVNIINLLDKSGLFYDMTVKHGWDNRYFDNALALALMKIKDQGNLNFRRGEFAKKKKWLQYKKDFLKTGSIFLIILFLCSLNFFVKLYDLNNKIGQVNVKIHSVFKSAFPKTKKIFNPFLQMKANVLETKKNKLLFTDGESTIKVIDVLSEISRVVSTKENIILTNFVFNQANVVVSGDTLTFKSVDNVKLSLEKSDLFANVTINYANMSKYQNKIKFKLKIDL